MALPSAPNVPSRLVEPLLPGFARPRKRDLARSGRTAALIDRGYRSAHAGLRPTSAVCAATTQYLRVSLKRGVGADPSEQIVEHKADVVVLGAGIVGVSAALHLQQRGRDVILVDRRARAGEETSY